MTRQVRDAPLYLRLWLAAVATAVPANLRTEWMAEWRGEIAALMRTRPPLRETLRFSAGAVFDARTVSQLNQRSEDWLASPLACLTAMGAMTALAGGMLALSLHWFPEAVSVASIEGHFIAFTAFLLCGVIAVISSGTGCRRTQRAWSLVRVRWTAFSVVQVTLGAVGTCAATWAVAVPLANGKPQTHCLLVGAILVVRWVMQDQRTRCPICLHRMTFPVTVGSAAHSFLDWSGTEYYCRHGHGRLQVPAVGSGSLATEKWTPLDKSWSGLFPS